MKVITVAGQEIEVRGDLYFIADEEIAPERMRLHDVVLNLGQPMKSTIVLDVKVDPEELRKFCASLRRDPPPKPTPKWKEANQQPWKRGRR